MGPLLGGFLCEFLGWQSTFYFTAIFGKHSCNFIERHDLTNAYIIGGIVLVLVALFLPETVRKPRPSMVKGKQTSVFSNLRTAFTPMVVMLGDPTILIMTLYGSIIFASLFFLVSYTRCNVSPFTDAINVESYHHRHV